MLHRLFRYSPSHIIIVSALVSVAIGTLLLSLSIAQKTPIQTIDRLFTTISAITNTGMLTVPINSFTTFGKIILITLAQVGSVGLVIGGFYLMDILLGLPFSAHARVAEILDIDWTQTTRNLIKFILLFTIIAETIGALIMLPEFLKDHSFFPALGYSFFHAIAAFTNSGLTLFEDSLERFSRNSVILTTMSILMLSGTIGFFALREATTYLSKLYRRIKRYFRFSLSTTIALHTTVMLLIISCIIFYYTENNLALEAYNPFHTVLNTIFTMISAMGSGFSSLGTVTFSMATLLLIMVIAFIGTSPGSTGSGIKTTTTAIFLSALRAAITRKPYVEIYGNCIIPDQLRKAIATVTLALIWIVVATFLLLVIEKNYTFIETLFETVSSFATLGLSLGITSSLSTKGKLLLMLNMLFGKLGPFTLIFVLRQGLSTLNDKSETTITQ